MKSRKGPTFFLPHLAPLSENNNFFETFKAISRISAAKLSVMQLDHVQMSYLQSS